jgi:endogenous inhibitor of DNA gyrase (YacG/DUF329 family)
MTDDLIVRMEALENSCAAGCGAPLSEESPSGDFCSEKCQVLWMRAKNAGKKPRLPSNMGRSPSIRRYLPGLDPDEIVHRATFSISPEQMEAIIQAMITLRNPVRERLGRNE